MYGFSIFSRIPIFLSVRNNLENLVLWDIFGSRPDPEINSRSDLTRHFQILAHLHFARKEIVDPFLQIDKLQYTFPTFLILRDRNELNYSGSIILVNTWSIMYLISFDGKFHNIDCNILLMDIYGFPFP